MSSFAWKLETWRPNFLLGEYTGEIRDFVIASVARRSAFSNLKSKLRIATSLCSSKRRVLPSSRAVLRSDLPGVFTLFTLFTPFFDSGKRHFHCKNYLVFKAWLSGSGFARNYRNFSVLGSEPVFPSTLQLPVLAT